MKWTEEALSELPVKGVFRLRGESMTRIEVFSDAAFAFAVTMLVVSLSSIPRNYDELIEAMKGIPAFAASFAIVMVFWAAHRNWSRRFGIDDSLSVVLSIALIFVVLVYVYPLKLITSTFFSFVSGGFFPSGFEIGGPEEIVGLLFIYGIGACALAGIQAGLYARARRVADALCLDSRERIATQLDFAMWSAHSIVGLGSALLAVLLPAAIGVYAGFAYFLMPIASPLIANHYRKRIQSLD